jgi:predicted DNA-binding protein (MmcQ/YjbR family)
MESAATSEQATRRETSTQNAYPAPRVADDQPGENRHAVRSQTPETDGAGAGVSPAAFDAWCLSRQGASKVVQWGGSSVYKLGPKMFAIAGLSHGEAPPSYVFKVSEIAYALLIEHGLARPAPYLRGAKWVQLTDHDALPDEELRAYLDQSHALVAAKLTRATRKELGLDGA